MTYATLMVQLELGQPNTHVLQVAADLARRFSADVIGIAACQPMQIVVGDGYICGDLVAENDHELVAEMTLAETRFRDTMAQSGGKVSWQSQLSCPSMADYIAQAARSADLIIAGSTAEAAADVQRRLNLSDLVMQAGRPLLVVPAGAELLALQTCIVGWKDTRETRRAIVDALPLLRQASYVGVVELAAEADQNDARARLDEVCAWLRRHGVTADAMAVVARGDDVKQLHGIAQEHAADIIVAGAFGHSRLREWALGGMTRELLMPVARYSLLSH